MCACGRLKENIALAFVASADALHFNGTEIVGMIRTICLHSKVLHDCWDGSRSLGVGKAVLFRACFYLPIYADIQDLFAQALRLDLFEPSPAH